MRKNFNSEQNFNDRIRRVGVCFGAILWDLSGNGASIKAKMNCAS